MKRMVVSICFILCVAGHVSAVEQPLRVTVQQLLATPGRFAGKRVDVTGWYVAFNEASDLYASKKASYTDLDHSIWLEPDIWDPSSRRQRPLGVADSRRVDNRRVRVIGTFHYQPRPDLGPRVPYAKRLQGFGSYRLSKRAILNITYIQPAH
jgi:hypothetical protein